MAEFLAGLALANLVAGGLILLVLGLRRPVRRAFGARIAYGLWALPLLGALAGLLPAPVRIVHAAPAGPAAGAVAQSAPDLWPLVFILWLAGTAASLVWMTLAQRRFLRDAARGKAGPAVAGVLRPRVITPADFEARYTPREQVVVMAHEAMHLERQDARVNALAAAARCLNWFNPLVHAAVFHMRADQELACDAQVVSRHPAARRTYAEAMLKTQLAAHPLPLGCYWPGDSDHPLTERIAMLTLEHPGRARAGAGVALVAALAVGAGVIGWAAQPARSQAAPAAAAPVPAPPAPPAPVVRAEPLAPVAPPIAAPPARPVRPYRAPPATQDPIAAAAGAAAARAVAENREQIAALAADAAALGTRAAAAAVADGRVREAVERSLEGLDARIAATVEQAVARARLRVAEVDQRAIDRALEHLDERVAEEVNRAFEGLDTQPPALPPPPPCSRRCPGP